MVFVSGESSKRFLKGSGRMLCNEMVFLIDSPRSVEELPSLNLCLRIRSALRTGRNIEN